MNWKSFLVGTVFGIVVSVSVLVLFARYEPASPPAVSTKSAIPPAADAIESGTDVTATSIPSAAAVNGDETVSGHFELSDDGRVAAPVTSSHGQLLGDTNRSDKTSGSPGEVHNALEQEPIDYEWSYFMEQALGQYFSAHPEIVNFEIAGIECRTTICEIQAFGFDETTNARWGILLSDLRNQSWAEFGQTSSSSSTIEGRLVIISHLHRRENAP